MRVSAIPVLVLLTLVSACSTPDGGRASATASAPTLSVERVAALPSLIGTAPSALSWSPDSTRLAFLWNEQGWPLRDVYLVGADGTGRRRLTDVQATDPVPAPPGGETTEALAARMAARARGGISELLWDGPDAVLFVHRGRAFRAAVAAGADPPVPLALDAGVSDLALSPDRARLAYLRNGDLWVADRDGRDVTRLTSIGVAGIGTVPLGTYNRADREVGTGVWGADWPPLAWSPDGTRIAFHAVDRRHIRRVPFPSYLGKDTIVSELRRGYPGDENERRTLHVVAVATKVVRDLGLPEPGHRAVSDFSWSSSGRLLVDHVSDTGAERWLYVVEPGSTTLRQVWHDRRDSRIYPAYVARWHWDDRRILLVADLEERDRLYAIDPDTPSPSPTPLTPGAWDVAGERGAAVVQVVPGAKAAFVTGTGQGPYERHVYRVTDGAVPERLTSSAGVHVPTVSPDGRVVATAWSDDATPPELLLSPTAATAAHTRVTVSPPAEFGQHAFVRPRYATFKNAVDGFEVHARILEPPGLDRTRRHPVVFGPVYSNTVRNRWGGVTGTLQQLLVQRGYIVVQVDVRGSVGYGRAFREAFLMDYGGKDLDDLQAVVEGLAAALRGSGPGGNLGQQLRRPAQRLRAPQASRSVHRRRRRRSGPRSLRLRARRRRHHARTRHASRGVRPRVGDATRRGPARSPAHRARDDGRRRALPHDDGARRAADAARQGLRSRDGAGRDPRLGRARALRDLLLPEARAAFRPLPGATAHRIPGIVEPRRPSIAVLPRMLAPRLLRQGHVSEVPLPAHDSVATHCTRVILAALVALALSPAPVTAARPPAVLFTDVPSGPVSGGIRGAGAPLAIFGTGFGATRGSSTVTIGGIEVAAYLVWGSRNAHNETLDLIVVEPGPAVSGGAVVVTVDGQASTPGVTFTAAAGEVFVVAPDGNDAATCRVDAPCRRIGVVATSRMQPGDVLLVRGGEYDEGEVWLRDEYGHSGTALRPKVIRRYPGEEPLFSNAARPIILDANHIVISGLRFANGKSIGIGSNERGRTGVHVVDASFEGVIAWDAIGTHGDDHVLAGNVCRVSGSTVGTQGHCYYISFGRGVRLLHNIGSGAPGYGIHVFDQRRQAQDFTRTIADLVIEGNIVSGSTLRSGMILSMADESGLGNAIDGVVVRNNVLVGNNHLGLTINGIVRNVQVLNNTFSRNGRQGLYVASQATVNGVTVQNNLFDEGPNTACTSNCSWYQPAHVEVGGLAQSVSLGRNYYSGGTPMVIGGVDTAPVTGSATFLDAAAFDFRPAGGSVVVDAGLTLTAVVRDYTGLSRPRGAAFDLGAFEYVADDVPPPPGAALALTGSVSGRAVTIAWTASGGASSGPVDLEARSRPNGWVVATTRAPASPLVVAGVPDGAYYVRIASAGPAGTVVSNQVRVVVGTTCEPPDTPAAFAASVSGNVVSLRWTLAGPTATTVELAVGYAPGATDLGPIAVGTAPLAVAAPPARYFVRARARNGCGVSPFTSDAEVRVGV